MCLNCFIFTNLGLFFVFNLFVFIPLLNNTLYNFIHLKRIKMAFLQWIEYLHISFIFVLKQGIKSSNKKKKIFSTHVKLIHMIFNLRKIKYFFYN